MSRIVGYLAAGLLAAALLFTATGVAAAHAVLVSADPADGTELTTGPTRVTATFNERMQSAFAAMTVVGPDGHLWSTGETQVHGAEVTVAVRPLGPAGTYTVNYRATSADGHVVSGSWSFRLTQPGTGAPGPSVNAPDQLPRAGETSSTGSMPIWPFVAGAAVIVAAGLWLARPKS